MALYKEITITEAGESMILKQIMAGTAPLNFTAIAIGDGELAEGADTKTMTALVSEKKRLNVETFSQAGVNLYITARLATDSITEGIYHREIGVFVGNTLFAYGNTGSEYDYIPPAGENAAVSKTIRLMLKVGSAKVQFTDLDTKELVTYDGLEQRIHAYAKPAIEAVIEEKLKNGTLDIELPIDQNYNSLSTNAQSGLAIAEAISQAHKKQGEYRTIAGADNFNAHAFEIGTPPIGRIVQIAMPCRSLEGSSMYTASPVYLSIFQQNERGWEHVGTSTNAKTQTYAETAYYEFEELVLSGAPIRITITDDPESTAFDASKVIGARVTAVPGKGVAYTNAALSSSMQYLVDLTFFGDYVTERFAGIEHVGDETHITAEEKQTISDHIGSAEKHITNEERAEWQGHIQDNTVHITEAERTAWNKAASAGSNTDAAAKVYTSYDELLDDDYGEVNHILFADKMPAGTRAVFKVGADLEAPLDQFGFLEIVKFDGQFALLTFTAYETDAEHYYPTAQYVAITDNAQVGDWKKTTYGNI